MAAPRKTFSEHWHLVSGQRLWLLPTVSVRRQEFEGGRWHVVENPMRGTFFRLHPAAYAFVSRLSPDRTVEEVWDAVVHAAPEYAPTQQEVVNLLGQMHAAGLLRGELPPDSRRLLDRHRHERTKKIRAQLSNLFSFKWPLFNPDRLLRAMQAFGNLVFSPPGAVAWLLVVGACLKLAADHWPELAARSAGVLDPANLPMLALAFILVKIVHELGHGLACRHFGGAVRETGLMFMFLAPFPYIDTTASWAFRQRWKRVLVASAGMIFEIFVAALAMAVWAWSGDPGLRSLAYQVVFVASVTTLLFNGNPLLRYDAYYIFSDLVRVPNLQQRSNQMLGFLCERYLFGLREAVTPAMTAREAWILVAYGIASNLYRIVLFSTLIAWVAGEYLILGLLMAAATAYGLFLKPLVSLFRYLASSPRLGRHRSRAVLVVSGGLAAMIAALWFVPAPHAFRAPGVVESAQPVEIHAAVAGVLTELAAAPGSGVETGDLLAKFVNPELEIEKRGLVAHREKVLAEWRMSEAEGGFEIAPFEAALAAVDRDLATLAEKEKQLVLRAPAAGLWSAPGLEKNLGRWMAKGEPLGRIIDQNGMVFLAVVSEGDASHFFSNAGAKAQVRLHGSAEKPVNAVSWRLVPAYRDQLPSEALAWGAGGEIETTTDAQGRVRATRPFFEVRANLEHDASETLLHGRSGVIRFRIRDKPLLRQWITNLRRFLQKQYRL